MSPQSKQTVLAISNATELISGIVFKIAGNEVANTLNGVLVSKPVLNELVASQVHAKFATYTSKGAK